MKFSAFLAMGALCASVALAADIGIVEEIIAKVNGDIITRTELDRSRKQLATDLQQKGLKGPELQKELTDREKQALGERIDQLLLVQRLPAAGLGLLLGRAGRAGAGGLAGHAVRRLRGRRHG